MKNKHLADTQKIIDILTYREDGNVMKMIYLYTTLNWYRIELFRSLLKLVAIV